MSPGRVVDTSGTIAREKDHRVRLTDSDIDLILAALRARVAMLHGERLKRTRRLLDRLSEMVPGNPNWIVGGWQHTAPDVEGVTDP